MSTANPDPLGLVGRTVDKYDIVSLAGEGGFSVVYRAEHRIWKQPVAIKFFTLLEEAQPTLRQRLLEDFVREGKLLSELSSRTAAILQARDIGRLEREGDRWIPYMVLEWVEGRSLESWLEELRQSGGAAFELGDAMRLLGPAVQALEVAHAQGIAHRDLKPANLMVLGDWRDPAAMVKVLDFGIAKVMSEHVALAEQLQLTGAQLSAFTPGYGAPEQFSRAHGATGPWTDVYAMALIVLELMRGGRPVLQGETVYEVGRASCDPDARPTPQRLGLGVAEAVERVFARAVALRPSERYPTMGQFWAALRAAAELPAPTASGPEAGLIGMTEPMTVAPATRDSGTGRSARSIVTPDGPTVAAMLTSVPAPAAPAKRPWLPLAGGGLAALLLGGALLASVGRGPDEDGPASEPALLAPSASEQAAAPRPGVEQRAAEAPLTDDAATARASDRRLDAGTTATAPPTTPGGGAARSVGGANPSAVVARRDAGATPQPGPSAAPGLNPWDPSSFGGRR